MKRTCYLYIVLILILLLPFTLSHACMGGSIDDKIHIVSINDTSYQLFSSPTDEYLTHYFKTPLSFVAPDSLKLITDKITENREQFPIEINWQATNDIRPIQTIDIFLQLQLPMHGQGFLKAYQHVTQIRMNEDINLPYQTRIRVHPLAGQSIPVNYEDIVK